MWLIRKQNPSSLVVFFWEFFPRDWLGICPYRDVTLAVTGWNSPYLMWLSLWLVGNAKRYVTRLVIGCWPCHVMGNCLYVINRRDLGGPTFSHYRPVISSDYNNIKLNKFPTLIKMLLENKILLFICNWKNYDNKFLFF